MVRNGKEPENLDVSSVAATFEHRASNSQCGCQGFDPPLLHQKNKYLTAEHKPCRFFLFPFLTSRDGHKFSNACCCLSCVLCVYLFVILVRAVCVSLRHSYVTVTRILRFGLEALLLCPTNSSPNVSRLHLSSSGHSELPLLIIFSIRPQ
jgi:hypothetical protein